MPHRTCTLHQQVCYSHACASPWTDCALCGCGPRGRRLRLRRVRPVAQAAELVRVRVRRATGRRRCSRRHVREELLIGDDQERPRLPFGGLLARPRPRTRRSDRRRRAGAGRRRARPGPHGAWLRARLQAAPALLPPRTRAQVRHAGLEPQTRRPGPRQVCYSNTCEPWTRPNPTPTPTPAPTL